MQGQNVESSRAVRRRVGGWVRVGRWIGVGVGVGVGSTGFGPFDTTSTILPFCTLWLMTMPAATLLEYSSV